MIKSIIINNYLLKLFLQTVVNMSFGFFCLGFILNLFEEINFFKDYDVSIGIPIILSALIVPSLLYKMFPFVILLSGIWFFLKIKKTDEVIAMKISGLSSMSIIIVPAFISIILGIVFITTVNPVTSFLAKKYESTKGNYYEKDQDYLATVTINGIWIKEKTLNNRYIVKATNLENQKLLGLSIYEFDLNGDFLKRIEAESANIKTLNWKIYNAKVIDDSGKILANNISNLTYKSMYDIKKIKSLYSNLDTVSFWSLENEIKLLEIRGYSTIEMRAKLQRSIAFPFFLLSMLLLSGVFTLGMNFKENNWTYVFIAIITSVLVFYFNDFSAALGKTDKLPMEIAVWMPIAIIFLFSAVGLIHANQK